MNSPLQSELLLLRAQGAHRVDGGGAPGRHYAGYPPDRHEGRESSLWEALSKARSEEAGENQTHACKTRKDGARGGVVGTRAKADRLAMAFSAAPEGAAPLTEAQGLPPIARRGWYRNQDPEARGARHKHAASDVGRLGQKPIWARPRSVRSCSVARPLKSTSKSMAAKSGAERPWRKACLCFGR